MARLLCLILLVHLLGLSVQAQRHGPQALALAVTLVETLASSPAPEPEPCDPGRAPSPARTFATPLPGLRHAAPALDLRVPTRRHTSPLSQGPPTPMSCTA